MLTILSEVTAVPACDIKETDMLMADLGMDSVASMELLGMLDEEFGVEVELEEAQALDRVGSILDLVRERYVG